MEIVALIVSGLSLAVTIVGTCLSNARSKEALTESRQAAADARWSTLQEAVQRLIGFDPTAEPISDRLANLRIAMLALVDHLDDWKGLDTWLEAERVLGATYGRHVMEGASADDTVDQRLDRLNPLMVWAATLSSNLRYLRSTGYKADALSKLRSHAEDLVEDIHARHGWELPPKGNPHVEPLI